MSIDPRVTDQRILETLRKLLKKEESLRGIGSEAALNEAEVASGLIQQLLTRHKLEMAQVITAEQMEVEDPIAEVRFDFATAGVPRYQSRVGWVEDLASHTATAYYCRILVGRRGDVWFVGRSQDRAVAATMFGILNLEIRAALERPFRRASAEGNGRGFITAFCRAAVARIGARYEEMRREIALDSSTTAMVRASDLALAEHMKQYGLGTALSQSNLYNREGAAAGREFGNRVGLSADGLSGGGPSRATAAVASGR